MTRPQTRIRTRVRPAPLLQSDGEKRDLFSSELHGNLRLAVQYSRVEELKPPTRRLRKHNQRQLSLIEASIRQNGFANPILIDSNNQIICGVARWLAATALGLSVVPTIALHHLSPEQIRLFAIAENRIGELSEFDLGELKIELGELDGLDFDLDLTGFSTSEVDNMLVAPTEGSGDEGGAEAPRTVATTRLGDVWQLGNHRLVCGDALKGETYTALLGEQKAAMVFADAPYNVPASKISGMGKHKHRDFAMAAGEMSKDEFTTFLATSFARFVEFSVHGSIHFQCIDWRHMGEMLAAGEKVYSELKNLVIYAKQSAGMGTFYRSQHELIFVWKNGTAPHTNNFGLGETGRHRSNLWTYNGNCGFHRGRDEELAAHPTVKPTDLVADAIRDCSKRGATILDPFGGSGTTLIAAERTRRSAHLIELDPIYCDVTIRRWERLTGCKAILTVTGMSFSDTAADRGMASNGSVSDQHGEIDDSSEDGEDA